MEARHVVQPFDKVDHGCDCTIGWRWRYRSSEAAAFSTDDQFEHVTSASGIIVLINKGSGCGSMATLSIVIFGRITDKTGFRVDVQWHFRISFAVVSFDEEMFCAIANKEYL
jgi:hypothetical protein